MSSLRACLLLLVCLVVSQGAESPASTAPPAAAAPVVASGPDLREALATATIEREQLQEEIARLGHQRGFLLVVVGLLLATVAWLAHIMLRSAKRSQSTVSQIGDGEPFPDLQDPTAPTTTVTIRKNATITIRNGATQQEEVTGQVQTRRFFSAPEPRRASRLEEPSDKPVTPVPSTSPVATPAAPTVRFTRTVRRISETPESQELQPSTDRMARPVPSADAPTASIVQRPATVRVDHQSDRMDTVDVTVKPGTTGIYRRQGFTMLEVMISLALLGTVLSSVIASIYTLNHTRMLALEQSQSQELGRLFVERIMAEPWGNLHSAQPQSVWRANYLSDLVDNPSIVNPLTSQELRDKLVIDNLTALGDLKVFIEYYPYQALVTALENRAPMSLATKQTWRDRTMAFRIVIDWHSIGGGRQQYVQLFARSE